MQTFFTKNETNETNIYCYVIKTARQFKKMEK